MKIWSHLTPHTNMSSRWIKKLHIRSEPLQLLGENIGGYFNNTGMEKAFVNKT